MKRILLLFYLLCLSGCVTTHPVEWRDSRFSISWPPPPDTPRITYLRSIARPDDIVPTKGKVKHFFDVLTGENDVKVGFNSPYGIATDNEGTMYVADTSAGVVHRYDLARREVSYIVRAGDEPLVSPVGVAVDSKHNLYVTDSQMGKLYKFSPEGDFLKEVKGNEPFRRPAGVAVNGRDEKFIVDVLAQKLYVFGSDDRFVRQFPNATGTDGLVSPSNVAVDRIGNVYVTDTMGFMIRIYDSLGNFLRSIGEIGDAPGSFARPKGVAVDSDGHVYVVDASHDNFQIFDPTGELLLFIGNNGVRPGEFYLPSGIFIDNQDRIFVTDTFNHRVQIFQYKRQGGTP